MLGKDFNYKRDKSKKIKSIWEAKLNKNQLSNDEYCDELVMKALESVASLPKFENNVIIPILNTKNDRRIDDKKFIKMSPSGALISYRSNLKLKKLKIKMVRVDRPHFPGVEKRNGKYYVGDVKKPCTLQTLLTRKNKAGPKRYRDNADANNFDLLQNSLKKLQTEIVKKQTDIKNMVPTTKETQSGKNSMSIKPDTPVEERGIPENFSTVKVAEIGAVVYTCKLCHHSILEKEKMFNHKCLISRPNRDISTNKPQPLTTNNHSETTNTMSLHKNDPSEKPSRTTRSRPSRSSQGKITDDNTTKSNVEKPDLTNISNNNHTSPAVSVPTQSPITSNPDITSPQLGQAFSMAPGMGSIVDASLLSKSFFLMPMGDNSYSLQLRDPVNPPAPPPPLPPPAPSIHVNHLPTSSSSYVNQQFPTSSPSYNNQQFTSSTPSYINHQFATTQSSIPTEHSILPDCNRTVPAMSLPASQASHAAQMNTVQKLVFAKKDILKNSKNKKKLSNNKIPNILKNSYKTTFAKIAPKAPYPIGLLCRNSSNQGNNANANQHSLPPEEISDKSPVTKGHKKDTPKYAIVSRETPGKIVISTVINKTTKTVPESPVEVPKKKAKKQKTERKIENVIIPVEFEKEPSHEQVEGKNEHFFTYINLDPMLQPSPYTLPNPNALQEPKISTTVVPVTFEPPTRSRIEPPVIEIGKKKSAGYACSICDLEFSREKKLFAHVKTHFEGCGE